MSEKIEETKGTKIIRYILSFIFITAVGLGVLSYISTDNDNSVNQTTEENPF